MSSHSPISPSRSERAYECRGSTLAEADKPDTAGAAAIEGSAAHAMGEYDLRNAIQKTGLQTNTWVKPWLGKEVRQYLGYEPDEEDTRVGDVIITQEILDGVKVYVDYVLSVLKEQPSASLYLEHCVTIYSISSTMNGTADAIIDEPFGDLHIIDLKFGRKLVEVDNNFQLNYYALAAIETFDAMRDHQRVLLTIVQPRGFHHHGPIRTIEMDRDELTGEWHAKFKDVYEDVERQKKGIAPEYSVGHWCDWCKAKLDCDAMTETYEQMAFDDFSEAPKTTRLDLLNKVEAVEANIKALREWAHGQAMSGEKVQGYKLIQKMGNRKWRDPDNLTDDDLFWECSDSDLYDTELKSPAQVKKLFDKEGQKLLEKLCTRKPNKPKLVRETDKNPEYAPGITDFQEDKKQ